jgi:hypothetical protein
MLKAIMDCRNLSAIIDEIENSGLDIEYQEWSSDSSDAEIRIPLEDLSIEEKRFVQGLLGEEVPEDTDYIIFY